MWVGQRAGEEMNSTRDPLHAYRLFTPFHPLQNEIKRTPHPALRRGIPCTHIVYLLEYFGPGIVEAASKASGSRESPSAI